ncbi:MAG: magnesium transporter CorA family protein [Gammaproteobacteria bacterium]|nr:magnesium transporter CorA family protein [Gammaproteobacteria bacterium]
MLSVFVCGPQGLLRHEPEADGPAIPDEALWVDLLEPTPMEERHVEERLAIGVPTREEMREIEASNRLYEEGGALFMTATVVTKLDTDVPENAQITFILAGRRLITNRYVDPLPFRRFVSYAGRHPSICVSAPMMLAGLLEAIINRIADSIERVGADLDRTSEEVFAGSYRRAASRDFRVLLQRCGQNGELISKTRETLVSLARLLAFLQQSTGQEGVTQEVRSRYRTLSRDVLAMSDHASFLGTKVAFILDATLGMINIDQNNILKIFSMITVFLLPPSVIAAFYGMNFPHIPGLGAPWGHWAALGMMLVSSIVPYLIFRRRGWL